MNGAVPVKTANCGFLTTLAIGNVKFCIVIEEKMIIWTLKNCPHAPDVPINLISVGALQEHHMSVTFSFQKTTITFPRSHPELRGLSFEAEFVCQLSLLHLNHILATTAPLSIPLSIAFTSFQIAPTSFELWHCHFGHLGQEVTWDMLTKNYATSITYKPTPQTLSRCIPCLICKVPQALFVHNAKRALRACNLIHINMCDLSPLSLHRKRPISWWCFKLWIHRSSHHQGQGVWCMAEGRGILDSEIW